MSEATMQCEGCGEQVTESTAKIERLPGYEGRTILAWCPDCQKDEYF